MKEMGSVKVGHVAGNGHSDHAGARSAAGVRVSASLSLLRRHIHD